VGKIDLNPKKSYSAPAPEEKKEAVKALLLLKTVVKEPVLEKTDK
jgi:hypothetical protein